MSYFDYYGIALPQLNMGQVPIGVCMTMKFIDGAGNINYQEFKSSELHPIEALGMLSTFTDTLKEHIRAQATRPGE